MKLAPTAVIAEAKRLIPNKPIRYVVNTHAHIDHSSGLRAFVAEGATIITHQSNKAYLEKVLNARAHARSRHDDAIRRTNPKFETASDRKILTDGNRVVELHHMQGFGHHEGMLMVYLPKEKILARSGRLQSAGAAPNRGLQQSSAPTISVLLDNIARLKLDVESIIPVHYAGG